MTIRSCLHRIAPARVLILAFIVRPSLAAEAVDDHSPRSDTNSYAHATTVDHDDAYLYSLPYADHHSFLVLQSYDSPLTHSGTERYTVDFGMPVGTPVHAAREGEVIAVEAGQDRACFQRGCGRFANRVGIRHDDGTVGWYFHLAKESVSVAVGDRVRRGQRIAMSGNTGFSNVPHLHFGVYADVGGGESQSIDVRFLTSDGVLRRLRTGGRYSNAPEAAQLARQ
jgi:murein DD-endopeptidase MepM/ murein hydrolase activator NlpD